MQRKFDEAVPSVSSFTRRLAFYMAAFVLWVVSFVFGIYHLAFLFAAVVSTIILSLLWVKVSHRSLHAMVRGPNEVMCGGEFELIVELANNGMLTRSLVEVVLPTQRWLSAVTGSQRMVLTIPAKSTALVGFKLKALKRGIYSYDHITVLIRDPFGLFSDVKRLRCDYKIAVLPKVVSIPDVWHTAGCMLTEMGDGNGDVSRLGMEFYSVREYHPGDPWRRIHWKATAHTGRLSVIELEREKQGNAILLVDCDSRSHWGDGLDASIEYAITIAASITNELLSAGATVTLVAEPFVQSPGLTATGIHEFKAILYELARVEPSSAPSLTEVIQKHRQIYGRSIGLVAVATTRTSNLELAIAECDACAIVHDGFVRIVRGARDMEGRTFHLRVV